MWCLLNKHVCYYYKTLRVEFQSSLSITASFTPSFSWLDNVLRRPDDHPTTVICQFGPAICRLDTTWWQTTQTLERCRLPGPPADQSGNGGSPDALPRQRDGGIRWFSWGHLLHDMRFSRQRSYVSCVFMHRIKYILICFWRLINPQY